jgi:4-amino-4-deoxy-L-arabinose transferase-like glycosyltransferase
MGNQSLSDKALLLLVCAICSALLLPALFMDGMFMDGLIYTCVGKNLAEGHGTFWNPNFSQMYMRNYHDQPPLMFAIEAVFFRVLGDSIYTERIYCFFICIACFFALRMVWNSMWRTDSEERKLFWLPVLLFFASPVTFYAYTNNVEEATMVVFALFSAAFIFRGLHAEKNNIAWYFLAGVALIASSMCKGFQGLFPIVIPLVWWLCVRDISFKKAFIASVIVVIVPALFYFGLSFYEPARSSYAQYFHDRILATFNVANAATTGSRFFILYELFLDLLPALFVSAILFLIARKFGMKKEALAFFLIGLAGILPLMVTLEQRGFYLVTGLPFVTTAISLLVIEGARKIRNSLGQKRTLQISVLVAGIIFAIGTITATVLLAGQPKRDVSMLHDVKLIGEKCGENSFVGADQSTYTTWSLQGYLVRHYYISLVGNNTTMEYYIVPEGVNPPEGYSRTELKTITYHLYSKNEE